MILIRNKQKQYARNLFKRHKNHSNAVNGSIHGAECK